MLQLTLRRSIVAELLLGHLPQLGFELALGLYKSVVLIEQPHVTPEIIELARKRGTGRRLVANLGVCFGARQR